MPYPNGHHSGTSYISVAIKEYIESNHNNGKAHPRNDYATFRFLMNLNNYVLLLVSLLVIDAYKNIITTNATKI